MSERKTREELKLEALKAYVMVSVPAWEAFNKVEALAREAYHKRLKEIEKKEAVA